MAQALAYDRQGLEIARIIRLNVSVLAPEVGFEDTATAYPDLHAPATEVIQHANFFNLNVAPTKPWSPCKPHKVRLPRHQAAARACRSSSV